MPGFHVNSDKPKDEFLIPLRLTFENGPLQAVSIAYPKPEVIQVAGAAVSVFTGDFEIAATLKVSADGAAGDSTVTAKIHYQACNDRMCFRPSSVDIKVPVEIR